MAGRWPQPFGADVSGERPVRRVLSSATVVALWIGWQITGPYVAARDRLARRPQPHAGDLHPIDREFADLLADGMPRGAAASLNREQAPKPGTG